MPQLNRNNVHHTTRLRTVEVPPVDSPKNESPSAGIDGASAESAVFRCDQCSKVFSRRENLSRHLKTHELSRSHRCSKCGKSFTRSDLLKRHESGHERWDKKVLKQPIADGSTKRRRVAFEGAVDATPDTLWTPGYQDDNPFHPLPNHYPEQVASIHPVCIAQNNSHSSIPNQTVTKGPPLNTGHEFFEGAQEFNDNQHVLHHGQVDFEQFSHTSMAYNQISSFNHFNPAACPSQLPFDFSSFLLPSEVGPTGNDWFSNDFYSAMRETGNEWDSLGELLDPNFLSPGQDFDSTINDEADQPPTDSATNVPEPVNPEIHHDVASVDRSDEELPDSNGRISRVSSPPNEASEEDKWPFRWNPNSRPILKANPIIIPPHHTLSQTHDSRFDITESLMLRLHAFLKPPAGREFHQSQKGSFVLPSLPVINIFIGLFFKYFSPQVPVLHHPTINTNVDLPPPLLAAIVVIGAIYSHLKHSRRFAIVLLDIVRWNLQIALECDNSLMREPMTIYAEALICHAGLWCGNKRAYELAEVVRGALVTYIRRAHLHDICPSSPAKGEMKNLQSQWRRWITQESQRRLYWVIYGIDCQFPSILNLPATISIGEVSKLNCPCDEEFWCASTARNWKNLLGPATIPPSRAFSAAVGPFFLASSISGLGHRGSRGFWDRSPTLDLNPWSSFLVLMTIQGQIFQFSQESLLARTFMDDDELTDDGEGPPDSGRQGSESHGRTQETAPNLLRKLQIMRRGHLADVLSSWSKTYMSPTRSSHHPTSKHFYSTSLVIHHLSTILLDVPLSDLQNAIGKDGKSGISQALSNLTVWAQRSQHIAEEVAFNAVKTIVSLAPSRRNLDDPFRTADTAPYGIITLFLCHVVLWVFATVSPESQKQRFLDHVTRTEVLRTSAFFPVLRRAFLGTQGGASDGGSRSDAPKLLFKSAAEMLTQLGTWGASLNLALLVHRRAEM